MQPDSNDIIFTNHGLNGNLFKTLYESLWGSSMSIDSITAFFLQLWTIYSVIAFALSAAFIFGIIYTYIKMAELIEIEDHYLHEQEERWKQLHHGAIENNRWQSVQTHLASSNPNDWKLAIIEADVLLERMLEKAGFVGKTIGDKLKGATSRTFATIDDAWNAHRVRNQIAHGGADFVLTQKIAKETLIMYERVFKEFDVIDGDDGHGHGGGHH
jgi:hypothetical protein